jgi:hypothetical protein
MNRITRNERKQQFNELFTPDDNGVGRWVSRQELMDNPLTSGSMGGNGVGRHGEYFGRSDYLWDIQRGRYNRIESIRTNGRSETTNRPRPIRNDIKRHYRQIPCVMCGTTSSLVCDHKNDLYNDPRVLNTRTQLPEDFQSLCNSCNLRKRAVSKKMIGTHRRQPPPPMIRVFGIDFTQGDENFVINDVNAMVGTYWYDPIAFMTEIRNRLL